ncbi:hypothetical protein PT974_07003 [Cladobotryum mycophilum]|uniref:Uncharacterized protein n=1 Tax=Cladobotryum mycophilum TaxID=491253 RepID=A0ABR0SN98_9HYPO
MNSRNPRFATYYDDQVAAHRRVHPRETVLDQFQNSSVVITGALLLLTVLIRFCSPDGSFEGAVSAVGAFLWGIVVFVIPAPLLFAVDNWVNSSSPHDQCAIRHEAAMPPKAKPCAG